MGGRQGSSTPLLTVVLKGKGVEEGSLRADKLAGLLEDLQNSIYRIAMVVTGGSSVGRTGAFPKEIKEACSLEFMGIDKGSFALALNLIGSADDDDEGIGVRSIASLVDGISALGEKDMRIPTDFDNGVLDRLHRLSGVMDDDIDQMDFSLRARKIRRRAVFTKDHRRRLSEVVKRSEKSVREVRGTLRELDLERNRCQIFLSEGGYIRGTFPPELGQKLKDSLDTEVVARGIATIRPAEERISELKIRELVTPGEAEERKRDTLTARRILYSDLAGIWKGRLDTLDPIEYAEELRKQASRRGK